MHFVDLLPLFTSRQFSWRPIGIPAQRPISDKVNCGGPDSFSEGSKISYDKGYQFSFSYLCTWPISLWFNSFSAPNIQVVLCVLTLALLGYKRGKGHRAGKRIQLYTLTTLCKLIYILRNETFRAATSRNKSSLGTEWKRDEEQTTN